MQDSKPLVSVGIPVYNGEKFLRQALDALLAQTYTHLEFVIADNASTDSTESICREYASKDLRICYYRNPTNVGVYANFRRVLELSSGEYFMWVGVDDFRPPRAIEDCVNALLDDPRAVMAHGVILSESRGRAGQTAIANEMDLSLDDPLERVRTYTRQMRYNAIVYGMYKRSALVQGWLGSSYGQDYLLCLQMCLLGPFAYTKTPMMVCREKNQVPSPNPIYANIPLSLKNLLEVSGRPRRKCWSMLFMGCYYLLQLHNVRFTTRIQACMVHVVNFVQRYLTVLAKEIVFLLFTPLSYFIAFVWRGIRHIAVLEPIVHRLQALRRS